MIKIKNYINGSLSNRKSINNIEVFNPALGKVYATCPDSDTKDLNQALNSAKKAFPLWSNISYKKRAQYLFKISDLLEKNLDKFSEFESMDNGKPLLLSKNLDIPRAIENLNFFGEIVNSNTSDSFYMENIGLNYTLKKPIGVVGTISPWNLPLYLFTWKIAPALVSGNCVVAKPSEVTPMTAYLFSEICIEAKLPNGVLNILHGKGSSIGSKIVKNKDVKAISFTGGTQTGKLISVECAKSFKKLNLEMGGKNPVLIFDDCDYKKMIKSVIKSSFLNQGQICLAGSRIYVQKKMYNRFKKDFINEVKKIKTGNPLNKDSDQGAIVSENHLNKISSYINIAKKEGCEILVGGNQIIMDDKCKCGWFFEPTVIENFKNNSRTNQEEIFGPVVTLNSFDSEQDAINLANDSDYGLASIIWTTNINKAHRVADSIKSGIVWINCWLERDLRTPFGGMKNSGYGKEGGMHALNFFTEEKNVCIKYYD